MIGAHQTTGSSANSGSADTPVFASGAAKKPAANSRESPGRNGKKTTPVSMKTMRKMKPRVGATPIAIQLAIAVRGSLMRLTKKLMIFMGLSVFLRGCAGSVRVACFSIVRNECAVANQSQTTNGSMQCASQCDDGWQICTNRQYVPMGACLLVVFGRWCPVVVQWLSGSCPACSAAVRCVRRVRRPRGARRRILA